MTQKRSRKARREAQGQAKKQRRLMIAGFAGLFILIVVALVILQGQGSGSSGTETETVELSTAPEVGALAPDFQLVSNGGEQVKLSDFRGRPVAVTFMHTW